MKFSLDLQTISFQDYSTFQNFKLLFDKLADQKYQDKQTIDQLCALTLERFGVNVDIKLSNEVHVAGVYPPTFNKNHILFNKTQINNLKNDSSQNHEYEMLIKLQQLNEVNKIDLQKAKVSGIFSKMKYDLAINYETIKILSSEEQCAVYLHEIGHQFTYFEMMNRVTTTNLVMMCLAGIVEKSNSVQEKDMVFKKADQIFGIPSTGHTDIININDYRTLSIVYLSKLFTQAKSTTGSYFYDETTAEQIADQFVSRLGGGRQLISGLDKLVKKFNSGPKTTYDNRKLVLLTSILTVSQVVLYKYLKLPAVLSYLMPLITTGVSMDYMFGNKSGEASYDQTRTRMSRIKNDLFIALKQTDDNDTKKVIIRDIEYCDEILKFYADKKNAISRFLDMVFHKKNTQVLQIQRDLEDIAFNDLFIKSEKLRLI